MKFKISFGVFFLGLILTIIISNFISVGNTLDELRGSVLRIHILANSDSYDDQQLKLSVRDALLENSPELFENAYNLDEAVINAEEKLDETVEIAKKVITEQGYDYDVFAEVTDMYFDERVYGDITMPEGVYKALRITIGEAEGHNWWCVMYPPLCIPAACEVEDDKDVEEEFFTEQEQDIMKSPQKYKARFMIWDKLKSILD